MTLYEIDQEITGCIDMETGEIIDTAKLDQLVMERKKKIGGVACWVKNLQADIEAYKHEIEVFAERKARAQRKIDQLKSWLAYATGEEKYETPQAVISFRRSKQISIPDEALVPKKYMVKTVTTRPDKVAIKNAIEAGHAVKGCALIENKTISIK